MSDQSPHDQAQRLSASAALLVRGNQHREAIELFRKAADLEGKAYAEVPPKEQRTRSLLGLSCYASLLFKAEEFARAEAAICRMLGDDGLRAFARAELKELLEVVWEEQTLLAAGVRYSGEAVDVALRGGPIGSGSAPTGTAIHYMGAANLLSYRVVEWSAGKSLRRRGPAPKEIQDLLESRATQPTVGSYRFSLRFVEPRQTDLFSADQRVDLRAAAQTFLALVRGLAAQDLSEFDRLVPDPAYRLTLIKLARNLFPVGKEQVEVRRAGDPAIEAVVLHGEGRRGVTEVIRQLEPPKTNEKEETFRGTLRALDLDKRWLALDLTDGSRITCKTKADVLDDVVGPMVNKRVVAYATKRGNVVHLRDVELEQQQ